MMKGANFVLLLLDGLLIEPFFTYNSTATAFCTNGLTIAGYNLMLKTYYNIYKQDWQPLYSFLQEAATGFGSEFLYNENSETCTTYFFEFLNLSCRIVTLLKFRNVHYLFFLKFLNLSCKIVTLLK